MARRLAFAGWCAGLAAALVLLIGDGGGPLAAPPLDPSGWPSWAADRSPIDAAFAVVRLIAVAVAAYLLVATVIAAAAELARGGPLVAVADVLALPAVRAAVSGALGVGLVGATVAAGASSFAPPAASAGPAAEVMVEVDPRSEPPTMQRLTDEEPDPVPAPAPAVEPAPSAATWTVAPGDHLWSVAERVWGDARGHAPTAAEVAPYWRELVEANRSTLADPGNPDLVFPGQTLVLPNVPA